MYKNYKIGPDGTPKYDGDSYRVVPKRRFTKHTEEWEKRLNSDPRKLRRRKKKQEEVKFTLKVKHVAYLVAFLVIIGIVGKNNTNIIPISKSKQDINITLSNAVRDFGNNVIKPSNGDLFLHIELDLENQLNSISNIDMSEFILVDENEKIYNVSYLDNRNETMNLSLDSNIKVTPKMTFEIPIDYKGEIDLIFNNSEVYNKNISKFNLE